MKKNKPQNPINMINLRHLNFHSENPLIDARTLLTRNIQVRSGLANTQLCNLDGELVATNVIHEVKEVDPENFVKIFIAGVIAMNDLSAAARRVFQLVLMVYENSRMTNGLCESVMLFVQEKKIDNVPLGMCERTYTKGLKELIYKKFLAPKMPYVFWVNPSYFFKGDRALLVTELRKKTRSKNPEISK